MRLLYTLVSIHIFIGACFGQDKKVLGTSFSFSDEVKSEGTIHEMIGFDGEYTYTLGSKGVFLNGIPIGFKFMINKWDKDMNLSASGSIPMRTNDHRITADNPGEIRLIGDKIIHLFTSHSPLESRDELFLVEYDKTSFDIKKQRKIATLENRNKSRVYFLEESSGGAELAVMSLIQNKNETELTCRVLNEDAEIVFERKLLLERETKHIRLSDFMISEGNVSFVVVQQKSKRIPKEEVTFHMYSSERERHVEIPIEIRDSEHNISDYSTTVNSDGKLCVSGFFYAPDGYNTGGVFTQLYDLEEGLLVNQNLKTFDLEFYSANYSEHSKKIAEERVKNGQPIEEPQSYYTRRSIANSDGSSTLVGEQSNSILGTSPTPDVPTIYHSNGDVVFMRTNKEGEIQWVKRYPRRFVSSSPKAGKLIIIDQDENTFSFLYLGHGLVMVKVDKLDGTYEDKTVISSIEFGEKLLLDMASACIDNGRLSIRASSFKRTRFITAELDKK